MMPAAFNTAAARIQGVSPLNSTSSLADMNQAIDTQASWIGYLNAFRLMMILTIIVIPLIALARSARQSARAEQVAVE